MGGCFPMSSTPQHLLESEHGQAPLHRPAGGRHGAAQGLKIAHVYLDNDYGRETFPILDPQAAHYGFTVQHLAVQPPGLDQKATWLRVKVAQPDWVILRTGRHDHDGPEGSSPGGVPATRSWGRTTCTEQDLLPAGRRPSARSFIAQGRHFPLIQEMLSTSMPRARGGAGEDVGTAPWIRGMLRALLTTEALRTAMRHFGHQPLTGAQVQWGFEHLTLTAASLKELGAEGLFPPITLSCRDHEGGEGVKSSSGTEAVDGAHRLDRHGSGAGATAGGGQRPSMRRRRGSRRDLTVDAWLRGMPSDVLH